MKKILLTGLLFGLTFGVAGASSVNGDFDGNPIVKVQSGGQDLKVDDVPATIYKGRTMVPIYLLKQLGADVVWNADSYAVNVTLPAGSTSKPDPAVQERELLKSAYEWLKDTDMAMSLFVDEMQRFSSLENGANYKPMIEEDYNQIVALYNDSYQMAQKLETRIQNPSDLHAITISESKVLEQIGTCKGLLFDTFVLSDNQAFKDNFALSMTLSTRASQKNLLNTTGILHKLLAQQLQITTSPPAS